MLDFSGLIGLLVSIDGEHRPAAASGISKIENFGTDVAHRSPNHAIPISIFRLSVGKTRAAQTPTSSEKIYYLYFVLF